MKLYLFALEVLYNAYLGSLEVLLLLAELTGKIVCKLCMPFWKIIAAARACDHIEHMYAVQARHTGLPAPDVEYIGTVARSLRYAEVDVGAGRDAWCVKVYRNGWMFRVVPHAYDYTEAQLEQLWQELGTKKVQP